jgi:prepilin-type N-terminal cleavage/methylation domain-containing protein/prepilin-type processing-associated H-X9-DG protein
MPRPPASFRAARGFTLVELLAVLAAVAVLSTLLFGFAARARGRAHEAQCKLNLLHWGSAFHLYAADHDGHLPHPDDTSRPDKSGLADSPHDHCYIDELPPAYMSDTAWRDYPSGAKPTGGFWQCPSARLARANRYAYSPSAAGYHSYAMNSYLAHDFPYGLLGREAQSSYLYLPRCPAPDQTILLFEQSVSPSDSVFTSGNRSAGLYPAEDATALSVRHRHRRGGEGCNVLFLDGHVEWRDNLWAKTHSDIPSPGDRTWYPYDY